MRAVMTAPSLFPNRGGRGSRIRTCDLKYPKPPGYQTALYPETLLNPLVSPGFSGSAIARPKRSEGSQKGAFSTVRDQKSRTKSRTARHRLSWRSSGDKEVGLNEGWVSNPLVSLPATRLHLVSESPELRAPQKNTVLQEAVKRGRIGVQAAAKVADLLPKQQKAIAESPKPRRAAAEVTDAAKVAASRAGGSNDRDGHAALQKAWKGAKALRSLWETADGRTKEWFVGAVLFDSDEGGEPAGYPPPSCPRSHKRI